MLPLRREEKNIWHHCLDKFAFHCGRFLAVQLYSVPICSSQITFLSLFLIFVGTEKKKRKEIEIIETEGGKRERENENGGEYRNADHRVIKFCPVPFEMGYFLPVY